MVILEAAMHHPDLQEFHTTQTYLASTECRQETQQYAQRSVVNVETAFGEEESAAPQQLT